MLLFVSTERKDVSHVKEMLHKVSVKLFRVRNKVSDILTSKYESDPMHDLSEEVVANHDANTGVYEILPTVRK